MDAEDTDYTLEDSSDGSDDDWESDSSEEVCNEDTTPLRDSTAAHLNKPQPPQGKSYGARDSGPTDSIPAFKPARAPGLRLSDVAETRQDQRKFLTAGAFFKLVFCAEVMSQLCTFTNNYARIHGPEKPYFYKIWKDVTPDELYRFLWFTHVHEYSPSALYRTLLVYFADFSWLVG